MSDNISEIKDEIDLDLLSEYCGEFADKTPAYIAHGFKSIVFARKENDQSSHELEMYLIFLFDVDNFLSSWHLDRIFSSSLVGFDLDSDVHHGFNT